MAKKKNRKLNVAHRRTKRKQMQKKRKKLMIGEKNRLRGLNKFDEKILSEKIIQSSVLVDEPEFVQLRFDHERTLRYSKGLLERYQSRRKDERDADDDVDDDVDMDMFYDDYRTEVIRKLITDDFTHAFTRALSACATRLKLTGNREKEELARITLTIMELADEFPLSIHPLVITIYERTIKEAVISRITGASSSEEVQELLDKLRLLREEYDMDEDELVLEEVKELFEKALEKNLSPTFEDTPPVDITPPNGELPAKALYKTLQFEEIKKILTTQECFQMITGSEGELSFVQSNTQQYITLKPERLLLECESRKYLDTAMKNIEELCGKHIMYLAKSAPDTS